MPDSTLATLADLVTAALVDSGVVGQGQTPQAEDTNKAWLLTNIMTGQWNRKRWLIYHLVDTVFTSTGAESYTVGPGGNFNVARPDRLENGCFFRLVGTGVTQQTDYPLRLIESREEYNRIVLKDMGTWPAEVFYDAAYPLGSAFIWPVGASGQYEYHLLVKETIAPFTSLPETMLLPPEYQGALYYNLICRLRAAYQLPPDPVMIAMAREALNVIRGANVQLPTMRMPSAVVGRRYSYNVFSDSP